MYFRQTMRKAYSPATMARMEPHILATALRQDRDHLLASWRQQVRQLPSARLLDTPTLNDHMPSLLDELAMALDSGVDPTIAEAFTEQSALVHGLERVKDGFDIEEVAAEYNILRACIHDLAEGKGLDLQGKTFHIMNRVLDRAIGVALQTYANQRALEVRQRREDYLAFVAHDLRTPLLAISLAGRTLERTLPNKGYDADCAQMLKMLRRSVQHLEVMVRRVLDENINVETEAGLKLVRREFELWPLVEALLEELQPVAAAAGTRLINKVTDDLMVFADASLLKRIFQNLIANAIKYTPAGVVTVAARGLTTESAVECSVSDNGAGVPAELLGSVFDKGESDHANPAATGLGLAIVKTFVEAHGGTVTLQSKVREGSTFRFVLPMNSAT